MSGFVHHRCSPLLGIHSLACTLFLTSHVSDMGMASKSGKATGGGSSNLSGKATGGGSSVKTDGSSGGASGGKSGKAMGALDHDDDGYDDDGYDDDGYDDDCYDDDDDGWRS